VLLPPVLLSDLPSGVQSSLVLSFSGSGLILRQAVILSSVGSVLVRSGVEEFQFGEPSASSGGVGHASIGVVSSDPSRFLLRQVVVHSDAPALVRIFGGDPHFGKFGGPPGVSASIPLFSGFCFLRGQGRSPLCMGAPSFLVCRLGSLRWGNLLRGLVQRKVLLFTPG
jgi:hypothetical protein